MPMAPRERAEFDDELASIARVLVLQPHDSSGEERAAKALGLACQKGCADVVRMLSQAPYDLGNKHAIGCRALSCAVDGDHADIATILGNAPYNLGHDDAVECSALAGACARASAEMVLVLSQPPYSLGHAEAVEMHALYYACTNQCAEIATILGNAPYNLGHDDAREVVHGTRSMRSSDVIGGPVCDMNVEVRTVLSGAPYMMRSELEELYPPFDDRSETQRGARALFRERKIAPP